MGVPIRQQVRVGAYILKQRIKGNDRYPLVLMLEPLFRCNLACPGCGKIDYPDHILNQRLSVADAVGAAEAERLRTDLNRHARLYYVDARPEISDAEYDRRFRLLQAIEERFPELAAADSPTQRVGAEPAERRVGNGVAPTGSLVHAFDDAAPFALFHDQDQTALLELPQIAD